MILRPTSFKFNAVLVLYLFVAVICTSNSNVLAKEKQKDIDLVEFYSNYHQDKAFEEVYPDCLDDGEHNVCPDENSSISCSSIQEITAWCEQHLNLKKEQHENAVNGCTRFVGYHVDKNHYACCDSSDDCDAFLQDQFDEHLGLYQYRDSVDDDDGFHASTSSVEFNRRQLENGYDDDDDDDNYDDDDDDDYDDDSFQPRGKDEL
ncbi:predicted protein [Chaetoceros tenuissimus]|uniref:Secreted protein n=1 Tax=Chaetoceros tenuissimus TaxID=426638 RepID=A0AAD3CK28_9STRA|nr:predicted protein [Chaetoceros tenuissimus]